MATGHAFFLKGFPAIKALRFYEERAIALDGPYENTKHWHAEMKELAGARGRERVAPTEKTSDTRSEETTHSDPGPVMDEPANQRD